MQDVEVGRGETKGSSEGEESNSKSGEGEDEGKEASGSSSSKEEKPPTPPPPPLLSVVISQPEEISSPLVSLSKSAAVGIEEEAKKGFLQRSDSYQEICRVCQQQTEEPLMELGCRCRGELAKAHRSCIDIWFRTRGSNKCEICQQVAANVPSPESLPSTNYWVWRVDPVSGSSNIGRGEHVRGCFSPLSVAFSILFGGLLLDVLISVSLGVSTLPVNIIIGVLIVLGLGTAFRLALECCHEWSLRRNFQMAETTVNPG